MMFTYCWGDVVPGLLCKNEIPQDTDDEMEVDEVERSDVISKPLEVSFFRHRDIYEVACGLRHSAFLLRDGTVYTCGVNDQGQLGHNKAGRTPVQVTALETSVIKHVVCGDTFTVVTADNGSILSWGEDSCGQCGWGSETRDIKTRPRLLKGLAMHHVVQVACGGKHCIALTKGGKLFVWGDNTYGQLGVGKNHAVFHNKPTELTSLHGLPVRQLACGGAHTFVVSTSGTIFGWGRNHCGQLGVSDNKDRSQPTLLKSLRSQRVKFVACGENHTAMLTADGGVFTFGAAENRQLGHSSTSNEINPRKVFELMGSEVSQIACGRHHTLAFIPRNSRILSFGLPSHKTPTNRPVFNRSTSTNRVSGPWAEGPQVRNSCNTEVADTLSSVSSTQILSDHQRNIASSSKEHRDSRLEPTKLLSDSGKEGVESGRGLMQDSADEMEVKDNDVDANFDGRLEAGGGGVEDNTRRRENGRPRVRAIFSGGDQCFLIASSLEDFTKPVDHREICVDEHIATMDACFIDTLEGAPLGESLSEQVMSSIEEVFSSAACLNASFLKTNEAHYGSGRQNHGVDLDKAREQFGRIASKEAVVRYIAEILGVLLIPNLPSSPPDVEALRLYLLLIESPVFTDPSPERYGTLVVQFAEALCSLKTAGANVISQWWSTLQPRHLNRILTTYKLCMMGQLSMTPKVADRPTLRRNIKTCLEVLSKLCKMNSQNNEILPYYLFYINELTENVGIREHFLEWLQRPSGMQCRDVNFCDYPFVLDANAKTQLLKEDAILQMQSAIEDVQRRNFSVEYFFDPINPYLVLKIDRKNIVQSALTELSRQGSMDIKKPLMVTFLGEEAVDAGGLKKEFFMLILREILSPKFGMFRHYEGLQTIWFNNKSFEDGEMFCLVGVIVGLAIYNLTIISLPFPLALYKKLLKRPANTLEDLKQLDSLVAGNLQKLLDMEEAEDVLDLGLTFQIATENFGEVETTELKPGGAEVDVTLENKQEYVDRYVDFVLNTSVEKQYSFFSKGFLHVCGGRVFNLFHPQELMDMVIGDEHYDWDEFEQSVEYKGEYYRQHPTIKIFWEVFRELVLEQKKKFLVFLTGTDRVPIQGMKTLRAYIQPVRSGDDFLPVAHTCFNLLDLPIYKTKDKLRDKLLTAIEHTEGFALV
ncbi:probable E3 ubiquitin-protein ligase HERC4 [Asterias amurensis]|uniref:probable E3 ubiquitin-protein ligase HERC4 n=1 Tax=Asterias amurensis TaxID=7602 RepID=UPI003AB28B9F